MLHWAALGAALLPIVVAVIRARIDHWVPLGDNAYFTVRSRDVLTQHNPLIGAWSIGSNTLGTSVNNLGPLHLDLMAPFTKISPFWGAAIAMGVINGAAIVGVWLTARRLFGPIGVIGAMLATIALELTLGGLGLLEARQQFALLIPFWCMLWLAAALAAGKLWALPWLVFAVSLVVQTHFTFIYQSATIAVTALVVFAISERHRLRERATMRWGAIALGVAIVCWVQPLWDQFFDTGNMGNVIAQSGGNDHDVTVGTGVRLIADTTLLPPFWGPGTMTSFIRARHLASPMAALIGVICWSAVLAGVFLLARRYHRRAVVGLAVVSAAAFVSALFAGGMIPPNPRFGLVPQNYYWMWPVGIFLTFTVVAGVVTLPPVRSWLSDRRVHTQVTVAVAVVAVVACLPGLRSTIGWPEFDNENEVSRDVADPLMNQFSAALDRLDIDGPITINATPGDLQERYTMMAEMQQHGIDFKFRPGAQHLARFGMARCETSDSRHLLTLVAGPPSTQPRPGAVVLARVDKFTKREAKELTRLNKRFGNYIRSGKVKFGTARLVTFGRPNPKGLDEVRSTPGKPATGMAMRLAPWHRSSAVTMSDDLNGVFGRWVDLAQRAADYQVTIFLQPHEPHPELCDSRKPGSLRADLGGGRQPPGPAGNQNPDGGGTPGQSGRPGQGDQTSAPNATTTTSSPDATTTTTNAQPRDATTTTADRSRTGQRRGANASPSTASSTTSTKPG